MLFTVEIHWYHGLRVYAGFSRTYRLTAELDKHRVFENHVLASNYGLFNSMRAVHPEDHLWYLLEDFSKLQNAIRQVVRCLLSFYTL